MKSLIALMMILSASNAFAREIKVPRELRRPIAADNQAGLRGYLVSLIKEYEAPAHENNLTVYDTEEDNNPCQPKGRTELVCHLDYLNDRWNGSVDATFTVRAGQATELKEISFDGSF